jgi:RecB family endonuclease NucS
MGSKYTQKSNYLKSFIKFNSLTGSKENMFQYFSNNTDLHEITKFRVFMELIKRGYKVFTEVEFKEGKGRADIVCFDSKGNGYIIEIVNSEGQESINEKYDKYPIDFEIIVIHCNKPIEEQLTI